MRFGGADPDNTAFFEKIGPVLYYTTALLARIDYLGLIVLGIIFLFIYHFVAHSAKLKILFNDIFFIIFLLFISYEIIYRMILPVPRTIAYIAPMFPFLAVYLSQLIVSLKGVKLSIKTFISIYLTFLIISLSVLFVLKDQMLTELTNRLSTRDTYILDSGNQALIYFRLMIISILLLILIIITTFITRISAEKKLQILIFFTIIIPSVFIITPFRAQKSIDFVRVNKVLTDYIQKSNVKTFYVHDSYQRSPIICYSGYKIRDGFVNEKKDHIKQHEILSLDSINRFSGYIIVDNMILEQKVKMGLTDFLHEHKIDSVKKNLPTVFRMGKISIHSNFNRQGL